MTELMGMKILHPRHLLPRRPADDLQCTRRLYRPVRPEADEGNLPVPLRRALRPRQGVGLVIDTVFLPDLGVIVEAVKFAIAQAVLALFPLVHFFDYGSICPSGHTTTVMCDRFFVLAKCLICSLHGQNRQRS